jgi:hypothetical protein
MLGAIVLVAGLLAAAALYLAAPAEKNAPLLGIDIRTNRDRSQLERMGGKGYVMFKDIDEWFAGLWQGRQLGVTIAVLAVVGFMLCRGLARVQEDQALEEGLAPADGIQSADTASPPVAPSGGPAPVEDKHP